MARQKRLLITGYNQFIGKNMFEWCKNEDWFVEGWSWSPDKDNWPHVADYDWVIHCYEYTDPNASIDAMLFQNFDFSCWLFNQCNRYCANFQYVSSGLVYGKTKNFSEFAECHPTNNYAWSKYLFDRWVFQQPLNVFVQGFRHFEVYGQYMNLSTSPSDLHKFRSSANLGHISVPNNAEKIRKDYVWVGDVCKLHIDFIKTIIGSGLWNCGSGLSHSLLDIAEEIATQERVDIKLVEQNNQETLYNCADLAHLKKTIGKRKWLNVFEYISYEKNK